MKGIVVGAVILAAALLVWHLWSSWGQSPVVAEPIYQGDADGQMVSLTVNVDWGEDILPQMLEVLKEHEVQATFFVTGRFAEKFPDLVQDIVAAGHEVGSHGYGHPHHDKLSIDENLQDLQKGEAALEPLIGRKPLLFAPAYGEHGENCLKAAEKNGNKVILWTADTIDWQDPPPDQATLVQRVTNEKLHGGTIILMHPKAHTLKALPQIIETIQEKGYTLTTVSNMLGLSETAGEAVDE